MTGPVISVAGLIMAVAFSGLIFSSTTSLNQMGFILSISVLVDTFVFRLFFVPSAMGFLKDVNWFPRKVSKSSVQLPPPYPFTCRRRK